MNHTVNMLELLGFVCEMHGQNVGMPRVFAVRMLELLGFFVNHMVKTLEILFVNSTLKSKARFSFRPVAHRNRLI